MLDRSGCETLLAKDRLGRAERDRAAAVGGGRRGLEPFGSVESGSGATDDEAPEEDEEDRGVLNTKSCGNDAWCRCERPPLPLLCAIDDGEPRPLG